MITVLLGAVTAVAACSGGDITAPAAVSVLPAGSCHARHINVTDPQAWLPDPVCTPGSTAGGLPARALCPVANTHQIRPPASYTDKLKAAQMRAYGFTGKPSTLEEDHLTPLSLGGAPRDPANLWPMPGASPNEKDRVERAAHDAMCGGHLSLVDAQHRITTNWYSLGRDLGVLR